MSDKEKVVKEIEEQIFGNNVVLYMKGTPMFPNCGFSAQAVGVLKELGIEFFSVNILEREDIRQELKEYANWPTYPQLWIGGELVGGSDIIMSLYQSGELKNLLEKSD